MLAQANTMTGTMSSDLRLRDSQLARNVRLVLLKQWVQELMTQVELMLSRKLKLQPLSTWDLRQQDQPLLPRQEAWTSLQVNMTTETTNSDLKLRVSLLEKNVKLEFNRQWAQALMILSQLTVRPRVKLQLLIQPLRMNAQLLLAEQTMRTLAQANTMIGTMSLDPRPRDSQLVRNVRLGLSRQWVQEPMTQVELIL